MNFDIKSVLSSKGFQAVEHSLKVAAFVAASGFLATLVTELSNNKTIGDLIAKNPTDAILFTLSNMVLAGVVKYVNLHKEELTS